MLNIRVLYKSLVMLWMFSIAAAVAQQSGPEMLQDLAIPLMSGLTENSEVALLFDSPEGRIINAEASGALVGRDVYDYYQVVLPSLGWNVDQSGNCQQDILYCLTAIRDEETLLLTIDTLGSISTITYALTPN